jgi:DNA-binding MarR family transcriptional regulator
MKATGETGSKDRLRMWIRLLRVMRSAENELREHLRLHHNTTLPRFDVAAALHRNRNGLTMTELSRLLLVSNGNSTQVVERMVSDGLVVRSFTQDDRRAVRVLLSAEGARQFEAWAAGHEAEVDRIFHDLSAEEANMVTAMFARFGGSPGHGRG